MWNRERRCLHEESDNLGNVPVNSSALVRALYISLTVIGVSLVWFKVSVRNTFETMLRMPVPSDAGLSEELTISVGVVSTSSKLISIRRSRAFSSIIVSPSSTDEKTVLSFPEAECIMNSSSSNVCLIWWQIQIFKGEIAELRT